MRGSSLILDAAAIHGREVIPRRIDVPNPAAGADFRINVPGGSVWWVQTMRATFTASAAVANRVPFVTLNDSDSEFSRLFQQQGVTAGGILAINLALGLGFQGAASFTTVYEWAPWPDIPLPGGWSIRSLTGAIDVADQWAGITLYVLEVEQTPYMVELARDVAGIRSGRVDALPDLSHRG